MDTDWTHLKSESVDQAWHTLCIAKRSVSQRASVIGHAASRSPRPPSGVYQHPYVDELQRKSQHRKKCPVSLPS